MNLNVDEWKEFRFGDLISRPYKAKAFNKDDLEVTEKNGIRYITRTGINNGCEMIVDATTIPEQYIEKGNAISIGDTTATCFYQDEDFITGDHMVIVRAKWLNKFNGLFIVSMLRNEQYKYSYGRAFLIDRIQETRMKLPIQYNQDGTPYIAPDCTYSEEGYVPDWQFMEDYIKSLHHKPLTTQNTVGNGLELKVDKWEEFHIIDLFEIKRGNINSLNEVENGDVPIVSASGDNEGISFYGNVLAPYCNNITVSMNGVNTGFTAYHGYEFNINSDCCVLLQKFDMNQCIGIFIATVIGMLRYKYSYGRKMTVERISVENIRLPIQHNPDGTPYIDPNHTYSEDGYVPDWQFMEDYIRSLPYGDRL